MNNEQLEQDPVLPLTVYGLEISYFTGKLESALRYMGLPHTRESAVPEGQEPESTGAFGIPGMRLATGEWMSDTTRILQWLDQRYPAFEIIPRDPALRFLSLLLEDYADEWLWRPAMHYRWDYEESAQLQSRVIGNEAGKNEPYPQWLIRFVIRNRQRGLFTNGDGVSPETWDHVESVYLNTLKHFTDILADRSYLLGTRPSLVDFGFFGPMFRHFSMDPTSARIMRESAPAVYEWVARVWNARSSNAGELRKDVPADWGPMLSAVGSGYLPYLLANAQAWQRGESHFDVDIEGAHYKRIRTSIYRVSCLLALRRELQAVPEPQNDELRSLLQTHGCLAALAADEDFGELPTHAINKHSANPGSMTGVTPHDTDRFHLWPVRRMRPRR